MGEGCEGGRGGAALRKKKKPIAFCLTRPRPPHSSPRSSVLSPQRLVSRFPPPDENVDTLYAVLEAAIAKYPNVR